MNKKTTITRKQFIQAIRNNPDMKPFEVYQLLVNGTSSIEEFIEFLEEMELPIPPDLEEPNPPVEEPPIKEEKEKDNTLEILNASGVVDIDLEQYNNGKIKLNFVSNGEVKFSNYPKNKKGVTCSIIILTEENVDKVELPKGNGYYQFGNISYSKRNKVICEFSNFVNSGLEVDIMVNQEN